MKVRFDIDELLPEAGAIGYVPHLVNLSIWENNSWTVLL